MISFNTNDYKPSNGPINLTILKKYYNTIKEYPTETYAHIKKRIYKVILAAEQGKCKRANTKCTCSVDAHACKCECNATAVHIMM